MKVRVLYRDKNGEGHFADVEAESEKEAIWNVALDSSDAEYVDSWPWNEAD